jgi:hypothetical protein
MARFELILLVACAIGISVSVADSVGDRVVHTGNLAFALAAHL